MMYIKSHLQQHIEQKLYYMINNNFYVTTQLDCFFKFFCYLNEKNAYLEQFENNHKKKFFDNPVRDYIFVIMLMPPKSSNPIGIE